MRLHVLRLLAPLLLLTLALASPVPLLRSCQPPAPNNNTQISVGECQDQVYFITLGLGAPVQYLNFQINTMCDYLWVAQADLVNISGSLELGQSRVQAYIDGDRVEGDLGYDLVTVDGTNVSARSEVVSVPVPQLLSSPVVDGVVGLSFSPVPNFLDNAAETGQISSAVFALQLGTATQNSTLYYNTIPQEILNSVVYVPVLGSKYWQVNVRNFRVNGYEFQTILSKTAIVDTSTTMLYVNPALYKALYKKIFYRCQIDTLRRITCPDGDGWPDIEIVLDGVRLSVSASSYFKQDNGEYLLQVGPTENENSSLLIGTRFLQGYTMVFDKANSQIGFNGTAIGQWQLAFLVMEGIMTLLILAGFGTGVWLFFHLRVPRRAKKEKSRQKLIQLSGYFMEH